MLTYDHLSAVIFIGLALGWSRKNALNFVLKVGFALFGLWGLGAFG